MTIINSFRNKYRFLSNFWPTEIVFEGIVYPSVEHAYQAAKTLHTEQRLQIKYAKTPGEAKRRGKKITIRDNWDFIKWNVMLTLVRLKFHNNAILKQALLDTGDAEMVEGNTWGDVFWGVCNGKGENHLGKILMKVREEIKTDDEQSN